jgi:hypothetical protein
VGIQVNVCYGPVSHYLQPGDRIPDFAARLQWQAGGFYGLVIPDEQAWRAF